MIVHRSRLVGALTLALLVASIHTGRAGCSSCDPHNLLCGPNCLLVVCQRLGVDATLEELKVLSSCDEKAGTTLLGLQTAAKAKGLQALGMKVSVAELAASGGQAIAHLWDNHSLSWSLEMPVLSRLDGERPTHSIKCRNAGSAELVISKVEASCSCIVPLKLPAAIPAGEEGVIDLLFDSEGQAAGVAKTLYVSSNDPITPVAQFQVGGYVRSKTLRFSPREVKFGKPRRNSESVRELRVLSTPEDSVKVTSVASDSPSVEATLQPDAPLGNIKGDITVHTSDPAQPEIRIPVYAYVEH